jgi:hypothetical protein
MRGFGIVLFVLVSASALAVGQPPGTPVVVPRAEQVDLRSKAGREYRLFLQGPAKDSPAPPGGYPVYYFTDANASFALVASLARIQQPTIGPVVLVGIGYPTDDRGEITARRSFDLTPAAAPDAMKRFQEGRKADPARPPKGAPPKAAAELTFGGQGEFFAFVRDEVKPLVEKRFPVDKARQALFGHSFGGLFTLHALYAHPDSFQTYIAASPSLWLNPGALAEAEAVFAAKAKAGGTKARLLVTLGEFEGRAPGEKADAGGGPAAELAARLKGAGVDAAFHQFAGENHGSVVPFAHMRGLRFAFEAARREK